MRLLLAARENCDEALVEQLDDEARRACNLLGAGARALGLARVDPDPLSSQYPEARAFEAVLAVDLPEGDERADRLIDVARGTDERLGAWIQPDLCGALVAQRRRVTGGEGPTRFIYLMRHKAGLTTDAFQEHWGGPHAEFGRRTQGINGYDQLHVDRTAARAAARVAGFAIHAIDGVPELHMESVEDFVAAAVGSDAGNAALEDEKSFVDARNSVGFVCRVAARREGGSA